MLTGLFRLFSYLPLWLIHALGGALGWLVYFFSSSYAERTRNNLKSSPVFADGEGYQSLLRQTISEAGKSLLELFPVWLRSEQNVLELLRECHGWEYVDTALQRSKGIIFLTPHMGCFEITSLYYAARHPITVLYRPPKLSWLEPLMLSGRKRGQVTLAPTDLKGVKLLLSALKRGEAIGILPDQVPSVGEGVWAKFFGRPAYTMTLVGRLQKATGATILLAFAERLPRGRGYVLRIEPMPATLPDDKIKAATELNLAVEGLVKKCPAQYLWSYNRYKMPRGAEAPPTTID